jgi:ABC-type sulfate/molybdate transport systems ATPase subunit
MAAQLTVRDLAHRRGGRDVLAVDRLEVSGGEHVSVLGPNGAGKSTLLRLLAGVEPPSAGEVALDGVSASHGGVALRRRIAYATQRPGLLSISARRNVELPLAWRKVPRRRRRDLAMAALERLRVADLAERPAHALSGGQQQRVNLARALAIAPDVLLLDEPAAGLDAESRGAFLADLEEALADRGTTVVHVCHHIEEALRLADRVVVLVQGQVRQVDLPEILLRRPVDPSVAALVGYDNVLEASVRPDGAVLVGDSPTGLRCQVPAGPVTVAVFANGVRLHASGAPGLPARVVRVRRDRGHFAVTLDGVVPLHALVPVDGSPPAAGDLVRISFGPELSAVMAPGNDSRPAGHLLEDLPLATPSRP